MHSLSCTHPFPKNKLAILMCLVKKNVCTTFSHWRWYRYFIHVIQKLPLFEDRNKKWNNTSSCSPSSRPISSKTFWISSSSSSSSTSNASSLLCKNQDFNQYFKWHTIISAISSCLTFCFSISIWYLCIDFCNSGSLIRLLTACINFDMFFIALCICSQKKNFSLKIGVGEINLPLAHA